MTCFDSASTTSGSDDPAQPLDDDLLEVDVRGQVLQRRQVNAERPTLFAEFAGAPYQLDVTDVAGIALPCLVVAGTESHPALRAIAATLARALPGARFVELAGSGHVTYAERPEEFARVAAAFATEVTSFAPAHRP